MKPTLFLRIASVLTLIHGVGHTIGGVFGSPRNGTEEMAVIDTMKAHSFNVMGSMRTYWDFFFGYGLILSILLIIEGVLFWQLATLAKTDATRIKPIVALFSLSFVGTAIIGWKYFFVAPAVMELLIAVCLATAFIGARPRTSV